MYNFCEKMIQVTHDNCLFVSEGLGHQWPSFQSASEPIQDHVTKFIRSAYLVHT